MTTKRSLLKKIVKSVFGRILRIGDQVRSISLPTRRRNFPKWFFWVKFIVLLVTLPWALLLIVYGVVCIVFPFFPSMVFENRRKEAVHIHQVAVDGRRVLVDERRMIGQGFELSKEIIEFLHPENMRPSATHKITVSASSASAPAAKKYTCVIFAPPKWGDVYVYFEDHDGIRCKFWEFKGY
jgi:hypothetical protein